MYYEKFLNTLKKNNLVTVKLMRKWIMQTYKLNENNYKYLLELWQIKIQLQKK